jgi:hypothetical protein
VVQCRQNVAAVVACQRAVGEGVEAAQQVQLFVAEQGDVRDGLGTSQDGKQAEPGSPPADSPTFACWGGPFRSVKCLRKTTVLSNDVQSAAVSAMARSPHANQGSTWISALFRFVTDFFTRLPRGHRLVRLLLSRVRPTERWFRRRIVDSGRGLMGRTSAESIWWAR